jgi:hypothetical protein
MMDMDRMACYRRSIAFGEHKGVVTVVPAGNHRVDVKVRFPDMAALPSIIARLHLWAAAAAPAAPKEKADARRAA